jgi:hypothetical protein
MVLIKETNVLNEQFFSGEIKGVISVHDFVVSMKLEEYLRNKVKEFSYFPFCTGKLRLLTLRF